jgi:starch synthase (maltosyl-transferring)
LRERIAERPILKNRIHWLGMRNDIPNLLQTSNVLVLPSLWEGMPNVILEAMMASRPVVATSVEGTSELVTDGETGWLVPPGHSQELGAALLKAALSPLLCTAFGQKGHERVMSKFSIDQTVAAYDRLWSRLLGYLLH